MHSCCSLIEKLNQGDIHRERRDNRATHYPQEIGIETEKRHHHDQRHDPWDNQILHRRDTQGLQSINLLIDLHGSELRGECGSGSAGHDHSGHYSSHLPKHRDTHQVRDVNLRSELLKLLGAYKGQNDPDKGTNERHYRERARPTFIDRAPYIPHRHSGAPANERHHRDNELADESEPCLQILQEMYRCFTDRHQERIFHMLSPRALSLWN
jgi:hypothetical protein